MRVRWPRKVVLLATLASLGVLARLYFQCAHELAHDIASSDGVLANASLQEQPVYYYDVFPNVDIDGFDFGSVSTRDVAVLKKLCNAVPECKGFNSNGWLKTSATSRVPSAAMFFVKIPISRDIALGASFSSSQDAYREMNAISLGLRIFSYPLPPSLDQPGIKDYKYAVESLFEELLSASPFATTDPEQATFFFMPVRCAAHRYSVADRAAGQIAAQDAAASLVRHVQAAFPYWNRSQGTDHVYLCAHDMGASCAATADPQLRKNAIALLTTADYDDPFFAPHKDIALPPHPGAGCPTCTQGSHGAAPLEPGVGPRTVLAFFAGNLGRGRVRPHVLAAWGHDGDMVIVDGALPLAEYHEHLQRARFCLFVRGHRGWSPRLMDAVWAGCVPVIVADHYHLPLHGLVDWRRFSIAVAERRVPELKAILLGVSESEYQVLSANLASVRGRFIWNNPPIPYDAFYSVLSLLWQKRHTLRLS